MPGAGGWWSQISITGVPAALSPTSSLSVSLPRHAIGTQTARSLLDALKLSRPAVSASLPWALIVRGSTQPGAG